MYLVWTLIPSEDVRKEKHVFSERCISKLLKILPPWWIMLVYQKGLTLDTENPPKKSALLVSSPLLWRKPITPSHFVPNNSKLFRPQKACLKSADYTCTIHNLWVITQPSNHNPTKTCQSYMNKAHRHWHILMPSQISRLLHGFVSPIRGLVPATRNECQFEHGGTSINRP